MNVGVLKHECVSWLLGHLSLSVSNLWRESQRWEQSSGALPQWRCEAAVSAFPYCTFSNQNWVLTSIWNLYFTNGCALQHCSVTFVFRASLAVLHMGAVVCLAVPICCWHRRCHAHDSNMQFHEEEGLCLDKKSWWSFLHRSHDLVPVGMARRTAG